jgi:hypothetical protein
MVSLPPGFCAGEVEMKHWKLRRYHKCLEADGAIAATAVIESLTL